MLFLITLFFFNKCWPILLLKYISCDNSRPELYIMWTVLCTHLLNCFLKHVEETKHTEAEIIKVLFGDGAEHHGQ